MKTILTAAAIAATMGVIATAPAPVTWALLLTGLAAMGARLRLQRALVPARVKGRVPDRG